MKSIRNGSNVDYVNKYQRFMSKYALADGN